MNSKHACKYLESLQQQAKQEGDKICHTGIVSLFVLLLNHLSLTSFLFKNMFCAIYFDHVSSCPNSSRSFSTPCPLTSHSLSPSLLSLSLSLSLFLYLISIPCLQKQKLNHTTNKPKYTKTIQKVCSLFCLYLLLGI